MNVSFIFLTETPFVAARNAVRTSTETQHKQMKELENLYIATGDGPNNDSRPLERVASSGSTFIQVSQL